MSKWPAQVKGRRSKGRPVHWRGPRRALTLDEQLEIKRAMREATPDHRRTHTAIDLAKRYGVSQRTIYRYAQTLHVPPGLEYLRMRIVDWAAEREIDLTYDDLQTLLYVIERHRDYATVKAA